MANSESTLIYQSNVYPILKSSFKDDRDFLAQVHDPFALEEMKKANYSLTSMQEQEYRHASLHCTYAYKDDYPWGTVTTDDGTKVVVCKCTNTNCNQFVQCRPDFDMSELDVYKENEIAKSAIITQSFQFDANVNQTDIDAAGKIFDNDEQASDSENGLQESDFVSKQQSTESVESFVVQPSSPVSVAEILEDRVADFSSFVESTQEQIIKCNSSARIIVNAGPGTGKTWTLIEKIIYMVNNGETSAEDILVLCFSHSAVEVIRNRLSVAADEGRIGYERYDIDIRTFDSFSTYMLAWVQKEIPDMLPGGFNLDSCEYDQRIRQATSILKQREDMLADYRQIIVDEVQDLVGSRAQLVLALLKGLPETCGFTLLGDSCQSLYDYLAADDSSIMSSDRFYQEIFENFPSAYYYALTENHRQDNELEVATVPYRRAILTGTAHERCSEASTLFAGIPSSHIRLQTFTRDEALSYIQNGTLGILTRTNGQALQISAWLRNKEIPHTLLRGMGNPALGDWISRIFAVWENETIDEASFVSKHMALFPDLGYDKAKIRWASLVNTYYGELGHRFEVKDLLFGLLRNPSESELYRSNDMTDCDDIIVSNIHRAKGQEFDTVIVIDDVVKAMTDTERDDILEHKVCYVALTRPKKLIERVSLPTPYIYITPNESRRCSKASRPRRGKKPYISHFEVGGDYDLDQTSFAENIERQEFIRKELRPGMRLKLKKCPHEKKSFVTYSIVVEDREHIVLGYTGRTFAAELNSSIQRILGISSHVRYEVFPHAFCDVYVGDIISCISSAHVPHGARAYGDVSIWTGFTITGFAAVDKDTY